MGLVEFKDVSFDYSGEKVLNNISFDVGEGQVLAIAGGVGSGKTTLLKLISGLLKPDYGQVYINLLNTRDYTVADLSKQVGLVFQNPQEQLFQRRVRDEILFSLKYKKSPEYFMEARLAELAKILGLEDILDMRIRDLPYNKKRLVALASVLIEDRPIVLIDEPSQGMDRESIKLLERVLTSLKRQGKTIFLTSNRLDFLMDQVDSLILLDQGEILDIGRPEKVLSQGQIDLLDLDRPFINGLGQRVFDRSDIFSEKEFIELVKEKYNE